MKTRRFRNYITYSSYVRKIAKNKTVKYDYYNRIIEIEGLDIILIPDACSIIFKQGF